MEPATAPDEEPMAFALRAAQDLAPLLTFSWEQGDGHGTPAPNGGVWFHVCAKDMGKDVVRELRTDEQTIFQTRAGANPWTDEVGCASAEDLALRLMRRHLTIALGIDGVERAHMLRMVYAADAGAFAQRASSFLRGPVGVSTSAYVPLSALMALRPQPVVAR
jgi:hypothetical protein